MQDALSHVSDAALVLKETDQYAHFVIVLNGEPDGELWHHDGDYHFGRYERGMLGRDFSSHDLHLVAKVTILSYGWLVRNHTEHGLIELPHKEDELPPGWALDSNRSTRYTGARGPHGQQMLFDTYSTRLAVALTWLYTLSPQELLEAYQTPDGGPLKQWVQAVDAT